MKHLIRLCAVVVIVYASVPVAAKGFEPYCVDFSGCTFNDQTNYNDCTQYHDGIWSGNGCDPAAIAQGEAETCNATCDTNDVLLWGHLPGGSTGWCYVMNADCHCRGKCM